MVKYHAATENLKKDRPAGFTTSAFRAQLRQMIGRFDLRRQQHNFERGRGLKPLHGVNDHMRPAEFAKLGLVSRFDAMLKGPEDFPLLLLWNAQTIPFVLIAE